MVALLDTLYEIVLICAFTISSQEQFKIVRIFLDLGGRWRNGAILQGTLHSTNLFTAGNTEAIAYLIGKLSFRLYWYYPSPGNCTFDERTFCSWSNERYNNHFDWVLGQGSSPSSDTGPITDYTGTLYVSFFYAMYPLK